MTAKYLLVDDCSDWQTIETIGKRLPKLDVVPAFTCMRKKFNNFAFIIFFLVYTFIIEPVDSVDAGTFVIATEQKEILGVFDLIGQQQADRF